jgi:AAA domain
MSPMSDLENDGNGTLVSPEGPAYANAIRDAKGPERSLVRCLTANEFFSAEQSTALVVPALGICAGPPTGVVGQPYVGKTIVALSAGMSVALGTPLWGVWPVQQGTWLHLDYEQGRRHTKSRVHRLARGFGLSDDEIRALIDANTVRLAVLPELLLTTDKSLDHFLRAFEGVRFVTCDSLRQMLGAVDENSSQVRALVGVLSSASDRTGAAVALLHHASTKAPQEGTERTRKSMPRGSSAIVDEMQSLFVLTKNKGDAVTFVTHEKDRELGGYPVADFGLRIEDIPTDDGDAKGGLRVAHIDRAEVQAKETQEARFVVAMAAARSCILQHPGIAGAEAVAERVGGRVATIRAAVKQLIADEIVVTRTAPRNGVRLYLKHVAPAGAA